MSRAKTSVESKGTSTRADRRDAAAPRVHFEALVDVGAGSPGGFEAESIDVSPDGIRLRTAYLPKMGERLVCRFDGFGGEVVAEGEVTWRREQGRGGEFGLRFIGLDEEGAKLLQEMCQPVVMDKGTGANEPQGAFVGSRVKLHIEGLGSPMRARVKDSARGEVLVGSSLEFLRVGRDIELEDVELGGRRTAMIEHVGVEIDRVSNVPQLVVALRYDDLPTTDEDEVEEAPSAERHPSRPGMYVGGQLPSKETTPEPTVIDNGPSAPRRMAPPPRRLAKADLQAAEELFEADDLSQEQPPTLATPALRAPRVEKASMASSVRVLEASGKLGDFAKTLGPKFSSARKSAGKLLGSLLDTVKKKRGVDGVAQGGKAKRMTAPPPSGALTSDGRRMFREVKAAQNSADEAPPEVTKMDPRRKAIAASVLGALAVFGVYFIANHAQSPKAPAANAAAIMPEAEKAGEALAAPLGQTAPGAAVATVNVPLFGATPLSTTELVPTPPNADALLAGAEPGDAPPSATAVPGGASEEPSETGAESGAQSKSGLRTEWGAGRIHDAVSLKLTMDGDVAGFTGSESTTGFTLVVPGRKSVSSASGLARKDKRIESFNVINYPDRAEVTVHFRGEVPAYAVKSTGNRVVIDLAAGKDGAHEATSEGTSSKKTGKHAVKSSGHEKAKSAEKAKKHGSKTAKQVGDSPKSEKKSDTKKTDKKSDAKKKTK